MKKWHVYLFRLEKTQYFKIGHTSNVKSRLNAINTASPHKIELVASWEFERSIKAQAFEKSIHKIFAQDRIKGKEWFRMLESDKVLIDAEYNRIQHGLKPIPERLERAYQWAEHLKRTRNAQN